MSSSDGVLRGSRKSSAVGKTPARGYGVGKRFSRIAALEAHPLANLFPLLEGNDFDEFCANLKADGRLHDKIVLFEGKILDGRNRQRACDVIGLTARYRTFNTEVEGDPLKFVIAKNLHRRHLSQSQRAMLAADIATMRRGHRTDIEPSANLRKVSQQEAAEQVNVSERSVTSANEVKERGTPELQDAVRQDRVAVSTAADIASLAPTEQAKVLALSDKEIVDKAKEIRARKAAEKRTKSIEARARNAMPGGTVDDLHRLAHEGFQAGVILADPPWRFRTWTETNDAKSARAHYDLMDSETICKLPIAELAADDCALFIWATWPTIFQTEKVIKAWGFRYSGLAWEWFKEHPGSGKPTFGTGYGTRKNLEPCLLAIRGKPILISRSERDWLVAPRFAHSVKPDEQYAPIEAMYGGPYLELFARRERPGWTVWGDQVSLPPTNAEESEWPGDRGVCQTAKTLDGETYDASTGELSEQPQEALADHSSGDRGSETGPLPEGATPFRSPSAGPTAEVAESGSGPIPHSAADPSVGLPEVGEGAPLPSKDEIPAFLRRGSPEHEAALVEAKARKGAR